ncbi:T9SS type A sorting domain-containing protein [candidate division KSB1 bacterium]|nr:T9SS type A sorting domain-containing protein [candidate division KSB1 bacterium]MBL7095051.1 T9SS type A sorting domain-containing protein [candidate division KSB1 bacterium]
MKKVILVLIFTSGFGQIFGYPNDGEDPYYLFSYFIQALNGTDGLRLARSEDALNWVKLNNGQPILKPYVGIQKVMRDPHITQGPDGEFHLVWTTGWYEKTIGYAHSSDLYNWSAQKAIPVMAHEPTTRNCWAPDMIYDRDSGKFIIWWASTIPGRFPETDSSSHHGTMNHRLYYTTTQDFNTFTPTTLLYDPGFNTIDGSIHRENGQYFMFLKNETETPVYEKNIRMSYSNNITGPWGPASERITNGQYMVEGPTALKVNGEWFLYVDRGNGIFDLLTSTDLTNWVYRTDELNLPEGIGHGKIFTVYHNISGNVKYYSTSGAVKNTNLNLSVGATDVKISNDSGFYEFMNLENFNNYTITPNKNGDMSANTIISYDAALAAQIAVGLLPNATNDQVTAADVDKSGTVLFYDAALIAKHAVGLPPQPESHVSEWNFTPTNRSDYLTCFDPDLRDFTGIVLGDVDGNWSPENVAIGKNSLTDELFLEAQIKESEFEKTLTLSIPAEPGEKIYSCDIILNYNPNVLQYQFVKTTTISQDFITLANDSKKGELKLGGYCVYPIKEAGTYLEIDFKVINNDVKPGDLELGSYRINADTVKKGNVNFPSSLGNQNLPAKFSLNQNYPNPFNNSSIITFDVPAITTIRLTLYDMLGKKVKTIAKGKYTAGHHQVLLNSKELFSGVYLYKLEANGFIDVKKMVVLE